MNQNVQIMTLHVRLDLHLDPVIFYEDLNYLKSKLSSFFVFVKKVSYW